MGRGEAGAGAERRASRVLLGRFVWGASAAMQELRARVEAVAPTGSGVLLTGETGTGKGELARVVHARSGRAARPFVHVDCAGLTPGLVESTLFGHERGAFTGAHARHVGRAEAADDGTLFLDEIAELERPAQARLLRLLQDRTYERVGGARTLRLHARVVAATNCDLEDAVAAGRFRADLYYRLAVVSLRVPPLRERAADLDELLARAAERAARRTGMAVRFSRGARDVLGRYAWPGNVRELMNAVERAAACWPGRLVDAEVARALVGTRVPALVAPPDAGGRSRDAEGLLAAVDRFGGNVARAARALGMPRSTLRYRLRSAASRRPRAEPAAQLPLPGFEA